MPVGKKELEAAVGSEFEKLFLSLGGRALEKLTETFNEKRASWGGEENEHQLKLAALRANQTDSERKTLAAEEKFVQVSEEIRLKRDELADIERRIAEAKPIAEKYEATVRRHHEEMARIAS
jgi:hypothetical protein